MEKLNKIIESMAYAQYKSDIDNPDKRNAFMFKHTSVQELFNYFSTKKTSAGDTWLEHYGYAKLDSLNGLSETFCKEVLWPKLKDNYIEDVVKNLESKLETTYKITIEQI